MIYHALHVLAMLAIWATAASAQTAPAAILVQPTNVTANSGQPASLSLTAAGNPTPAIQWYKDGKAVAGATNSSLTFASIFGGDAGTYTATVSNTYNGTAYNLTTAPAILTVVTTPPTITTQPVSQAVVAGGSATFSVAATGSEPILYRWYRNGSEIFGATGASLSLAGAKLSDAGVFRVTAINWATQVKAAAIGSSHTVFLRMDGTLWGMGYNESGQLGDGSLSNRLTPIQVASTVSKAQAVSNRTMFLKADGSFWGTGHNSSGQLGDGSFTNRNRPVHVANGVTNFSISGGRTTFVTKDGRLWAVGYNRNGQLGDGTTIDRANAVEVASGVVVSHSGENHTVFVKSDGTLWGMGNNGSGQLGGQFPPTQTTPVQFASGVVAANAGDYHTVFLKADGTLWGIGSNSSGELGDGTNSDRSSPIHIASDVTTFEASASHTMYLKNDGSLWITGTIYSNALGYRTRTNTPIFLSSDAIDFSSDGSRLVFIKKDGTLWGMGNNNYGQLSEAAENLITSPRMIAVEVGYSSRAGEHIMFLKKDGTLWALGNNSSGQLGDGTTSNRNNPLLISGGIISNSATLTVNSAPEISTQPVGQMATVGFPFSLSVVATGIPTPAFQWFKSGGIINGATNASYSVPSASAEDAGTYSVVISNSVRSVTSDSAVVTVNLPSPASIANQPASVTANIGQPATFNVTVSGSPAPAIQWFKNGALIAGATNASYTISTVAQDDAGTYTATVQNVYNGTTYALTTTAATVTVNVTPPSISVHPMSRTIVAGESVTLSVEAHGSQPLNYRWYRDGIEVPSGTSSSLTLSNVKAVDAGSYQVIVSNWANQFRNVWSASGSHTIFLGSDGTLWATGSNTYGQLGDGTQSNRLTAVPVASSVVSGSTGFLHTMFIKSDGTLWATGSNSHGQLGLGDRADRSTPVLVASSVASVSASLTHTMFIMHDGTLWATGNNGGQLGDGTLIDRSIPVQVASSAKAVSAGGRHTMFLKTDGTLWATGSNTYGQLGDGTTSFRFTPVQVASSVVSVSAGDEHTMFLKTDGTLWGMGSNQGGRLGDGTWMDRSTPIQVASSVACVSAGGRHTMFVKTDGTLWGMGFNGYGELGDGTANQRLSPSLLAISVASVSAGGSHTMFIKTDGTLWGTGSNNGRLGDGSTANRNAPVRIAGGLASNLATLALTDSSRPTIVGAPASVTIPNSERTQLKVSATGTGTLTYQWYQGQSGNTASPVIGATSAVLTTPALTTTTSYWVRITDGNGSVTNSPTATVTVSATSPLTVTQVTVGPGYASGGAVVVTNTITYTGTAPSRIDWATLLPAGWKYLGSGGSEGGARPVYESGELLEWSWTTVPASPIKFTYTVSVPAGTTGEQVIASLVTSQASGTSFQTMAKPDPLVLRSASMHTADSNRDGKISLTELTRVIELYNYRSGTTRTGQYKPQAGTEDGFAAGP